MIFLNFFLRWNYLIFNNSYIVSLNIIVKPLWCTFFYSSRPFQWYQQECKQEVLCVWEISTWQTTKMKQPPTFLNFSYEKFQRIGICRRFCIILCMIVHRQLILHHPLMMIVLLCQRRFLKQLPHSFSLSTDIDTQKKLI
jgi:hypothetical protein